MLTTSSSRVNSDPPSLRSLTKTIRREFQMTPGEIEDGSDAKASNVYLDNYPIIISNHERSMINYGIRMVQDLHGLTNLSSNRSLAPRPAFDNMKLLLAPFKVMDVNNNEMVPLAAVTCDREQAKACLKAGYISVPFYVFPSGDIPETFLNGIAFSEQHNSTHSLMESWRSNPLEETRNAFLSKVEPDPNDSGWWISHSKLFTTVNSLFIFVEKGTSSLLPLIEWKSSKLTGTSLYSNALRMYCILKWLSATNQSGINAKSEWKGLTTLTRSPISANGYYNYHYY
jgi:hypothetical protein